MVFAFYRDSSIIVLLQGQLHNHQCVPSVLEWCYSCTGPGNVPETRAGFFVLFFWEGGGDISEWATSVTGRNVVTQSLVM